MTKLNALPMLTDTSFAEPSEHFLNRELSWLKFNWRVLNEANDLRTPLLERVKFLAIVESNIDEFCMKRIGRLRRQLDAGIDRLTIDGRTPAEQIELCRKEIEALKNAQESTWSNLITTLASEDIYIRETSELSKTHKDWLRAYYVSNVLPLITPQAIDISHPFPLISNLSLNVLVTLETKKNKHTQVRIKVPTGPNVPRFVRLPIGQDKNIAEFVWLEDVIFENLDLLFPDMKVLEYNLFRVSRNANTNPDHDDAEDFVEQIEGHLKDRRSAPVVRLQIGRSMATGQRKTLEYNLRVDAHSCIISKRKRLALADLMALSDVARPELKRSPHIAVNNHALNSDHNIFDQIDRCGTTLLQHPYEKFETSVERFVKEASQDAMVQAIKMTIYRTSTDTKIVNYLIEAARNGKQVAVCVELTASFDEASNIQWARQLEDAGIHVSYGIYGLKTHCKVILVIRNDPDGLKRYAHIGTGNYHARNAKVYSDIGLLTSEKILTNDLGELFNYLTTGCAPIRPYAQLLTAPLYIKNALLEKIASEANYAKAGKPAHIRLKANALEDADIIKALYAASKSGVKIDLIIRDICRLRPQVKGVSDTINVVSIVGQFLEHSRIYHFHNAGDDEYFIGSADLMSRNLERRIEVIVPVNNVHAKAEISAILTSQIEDQRSAWDMLPNGDYRQRGAKISQSVSCQTKAIAAANLRVKSNFNPKSLLVVTECSHG